jgi:hypothetical protein
MNMEEQISDEEIARLCKRGSVVEVKAALTVITQQKREIEAQLGAKKNDLRAVRGEFVRSGLDHRAAQIEATATGDHDWRTRAMRALTFKDRAIANLKMRLRELHAAATPRALAVPVKESKPLPAAPERTVVVLRGSVDEVADEMQSWLDDGWSSLNTVMCGDALLVVFRRDFEPADAVDFSDDDAKGASPLRVLDELNR